MHVIGFYNIFFIKVILIIRFFSFINGMAAMFYSNAFDAWWLQIWSKNILQYADSLTFYHILHTNVGCKLKWLGSTIFNVF